MEGIQVARLQGFKQIETLARNKCAQIALLTLRPSRVFAG
jgi:hypothetical protein